MSSSTSYYYYKVNDWDKYRTNSGEKGSVAVRIMSIHKEINPFSPTFYRAENLTGLKSYTNVFRQQHLSTFTSETQLSSQPQ